MSLENPYTVEPDLAIRNLGASLDKCYLVHELQLTDFETLILLMG